MKLQEGNIFNCICLSSPGGCPLDMFKCVQLRPHYTGPPPPRVDMFKFVHFVVRTFVGKRAVGISLVFLIV